METPTSGSWVVAAAAANLATSEYAGMLVSSGSGGRGSVHRAAGLRSWWRSLPVRMNPSSSRLIWGGSQQLRVSIRFHGKIEQWSAACPIRAQNPAQLRSLTVIQG
jgi:hypothetical protein